jgi:ankyrin repeat protein
MLEDQLLFAAAYGFRARVELLLAHGVAPDGRGTSHPVLRGRSACELAAHAGDEELVQVLVAAGATPVALSDVERFVAACLRGDRARAAALAAADEGLVARAIAREPLAVVRAAHHGRPDAVRLLVELGFDVNAHERESALHVAAARGDLALVQLLLQLGADPTLKDRAFGGTPLGWARYHRQQAVVDFLEALEGGQVAPPA